MGKTVGGFGLRSVHKLKRLLKFEETEKWKHLPQIFTGLFKIPKMIPKPP